MMDWLPVIGTLLGAIVAGGIAIILHIASNRNSRILLSMQLEEERARWAAEHELDRIRHFYRTIEQLMEAAEIFRIQQAWSTHDRPTIPSWVPSEGEARDKIGDALRSSYSEISLLSADIQFAFRQSLENHRQWYLAKTREEGLEHLLQLEHDLDALKTRLGERYREVFDSRTSGSDIARDD